jgi:hypothetical protein
MIRFLSSFQASLRQQQKALRTQLIQLKAFNWRRRRRYNLLINFNIHNSNNSRQSRNWISPDIVIPWGRVRFAEVFELKTTSGEPGQDGYSLSAEQAKRHQKASLLMGDLAWPRRRGFSLAWRARNALTPLGDGCQAVGYLEAICEMIRNHVAALCSIFAFFGVFSGKTVFYPAWLTLLVSPQNLRLRSG